MNVRLFAGGPAGAGVPALIAWLLLGAAMAQAADEPYVPPALEPWRSWVLERHPEQRCPPDFANGATRHCVWISRVALEAAARGGRFTIDVDAFATGDVVLPGDAERWPAAVTIDGRPAVVTRIDGRPRLRLDAGSYRIAGAFAWTRLPESLPVPPHLGLLRLTVDGAERAAPLLEGDTLWLGRSVAAPPSAADSLEARVFRKIEDGVPLVLETTIDLSAAGTNRTVTVGRAVPDGFTATHLDSALPARLEADGVLRAQVEPGDWRIVVRARATAPVASFRATPAGEVWPAQEIWGFASDRALRVASVEGGRPIDLSQTGAPFQDVPGFVLSGEDELRIVEQFRGDLNPSPNEFTLSREAWLAFSGERFVVSDQIAVAAQRPTRITAAFVPGRVSVDGLPQLVTAIEGAEPGVELPQGQHTIAAVSEFAADAFDTVLGWRFDAASVATTLHLPPGWRLLATRGVDRAPTAWIAQWNVWNLFLVLVTVAVAARLLGWPGAVLAGATLVLVYHEPGSPTVGWLLMLVLLAGIRVSRPGVFRRVLDVTYFLVFALTLVASASFAVENFRKAIYPQLEHEEFVPALPTIGAAMPEMPVSAPATAQLDLGSFAREERLVKARPPRELYPEGLVVQTGPAVPRWRWSANELGWDGPVTAAQTLDLTLSPPALTRAWYVVGPVLLLALLGLFGLANVPTGPRLPPWLARWIRREAGTASVVLVAAVLGGASLAPGRADAADMPSPALLEELERRLTAPPPCLPGCAAFERVDVQLDERVLRLELVAHAEVETAVPLPARNREWWPDDVRVDDRPASARRDDDGVLRLVVPAGRHTVALVGGVAGLDRFELPFPLPPGALGLEVTGWEVFGVEDGRLRGAALQFAREIRREAGDEETSLRPEPITPYYTVERELRFGLEWRATTTVRRVAPTVGVVPFAVPLLAGESVLSGQVASDGGEARGVLAPDQAEQRYESALDQISRITLTAPPLERASERWTLVPSNLWHVDATGIPPAKLALGASPGPRFYPLPGETLEVQLVRPEGVPGDAVTVESVRLVDAPGRRSRRATLSLEILSSQGGDFAVTLPPEAVIATIAVDGRPEPLPLVSGPVRLPIVPGSQTFVLTWDAPQPVTTVTRTSAVTLSTIARNIDLVLELPEGRWPLVVGGPSLGPAVLYWGVLVLVALLAVALARIPGLPLNTRDAVLLGLGMSLCNLPGTIIVAVWLLLLLVRRRATDRLVSGPVGAFQVVQVLLALASVVAVIALASTLPLGLLGAPEMHIAGNGSTASELRWFQDQASADLPGAWVVSLPLWTYRVAMLGWSLWLAFAVVGWARWAWASYSEGAAWRKRERRRAGQSGPASG